MMKKNKIIFIVIIFTLIITGCGHKKPSKDVIESKDQLNNKSGSMSCTRQVNAPSGVKPTPSYDITYKNNEILVLHSIEGIESSTKENLDEYEEAYKKINNNYKGLKYYDSKVTRTDNSVTRDTTINYEKININKLLEIEGEEDNIIENGKASLKLWLKFAKKFGTTCHED